MGVSLSVQRDEISISFIIDGGDGDHLSDHVYGNLDERVLMVAFPEFMALSDYHKQFFLGENCVCEYSMPVGEREQIIVKMFTIGHNWGPLVNFVNELNGFNIMETSDLEEIIAQLNNFMSN